MNSIETAVELEREGACVDALRIYQQLYAENPGDEDAILGIAQCAMVLDRPQVAFDFYVKLLILNHKNPWGYLGRARVFFLYDQQDRAMSDLARVLELDHPGSEIRIDCAALLNDYGYPDMARDALRPIREAYIEDDDFLCEWLFAQIVLGNRTEVEFLLRDVSSRWGDDPFVALCHCICEAQTGDITAMERLHALREQAPELEGKIDCALQTIETPRDNPVMGD